MDKPQRMPPIEKEQITVGYMRLSDSAPLIMAREAGFFADVGLDVQLQREVSWANIRDRLVMGDLDAAQMLAPLPMMTSYGAGGIRANLLTGLSLSLNGNAITLSNQIYRDSGISAGITAEHSLQAARKLNSYIAQRNSEQTLTFATVHLFSTHTFLLRAWLRAAGIDPDRDVRILVLPPEQMCDSLARGIIDGYCAGEPWNTLAVLQGIGCVASSGYSIWNNAPEKVLSVTDRWHNANPGTHTRLRLALMRACHALTVPEFRMRAAEIMSSTEYLDLPLKYLQPSLSGDYSFRKGDATQRIENFHLFWDYQACFPWRSHAERLIKLSAETMGKTFAQDMTSSLVQQCYRTDLYRSAARLMEVASPSKDNKPDDSHESDWEFESGIILGADRLLGEH